MMDPYLAVDREHENNCVAYDAEAERLDDERAALADDLIAAIEQGNDEAEHEVFSILCRRFDSFSEQDIENCRKAVGIRS